MPNDAVAAAARGGQQAARYDTPWRRLPWTGPFSLVVWALALWAMSLAMTRAPVLPVPVQAINARFIELPKPPEPAAVQPEVHPQPAPVSPSSRHSQKRAVPRVPAKPSAMQAAEEAPASKTSSSPASATTDLPQHGQPPAQAAIPGGAAGSTNAGGAQRGHRFAGHPGAAVRTGAVGVVPPPPELSILNEERIFDDNGMGAGWSPGGWAQESVAEICIMPPDEPGPCPGQVFTQPGRPWCYDADPFHNWDMGTCQDDLDRAVTAFKGRDYSPAYAIFSKLAEKEYVPAQSNLCAMYAEGAGVAKDAVQAAQWCKKAAAGGDAKATYNLALMYSDGIGVQKDDRQAAHWFRKAAYYGYANAQYNLGVMYAHGIGVPQDDKQAAYWYGKAAHRGNAVAQYNLGVMYAEGAGVQQDDKQAVYWYCKGTSRGEAKARDSLAKLYSAGPERPRNEELNYFCWLFSAGSRNSTLALQDRDRYENNLTSFERENAIAAARMWKQK